jgi:hypothetical protein
MRTSNKILLAGFAAIVLIITGIHVALYAKIESGDLVVLRQAVQPPALEKHATPGVKHVLVAGLQECRVNYSDTAHIELTKNWKEHLEWSVDGDSLIIGSSGNTDYARGARVHVPVDLYLPADVTVHARYSNLLVRGSFDSSKAFSRSISGENSEILLVADDRVIMPFYWKKLAVTSQEGVVHVAPNAEINEMEITLNNNSAFRDGGGNFGTLSVKIDSTSTLSLRQRSLEKVKIIKP